MSSTKRCGRGMREERLKRFLFEHRMDDSEKPKTEDKTAPPATEFTPAPKKIRANARFFLFGIALFASGILFSHVGAKLLSSDGSPSPLGSVTHALTTTLRDVFGGKASEKTYSIPLRTRETASVAVSRVEQSLSVAKNISANAPRTKKTNTEGAQAQKATSTSIAPHLSEAEKSSTTPTAAPQIATASPATFSACTFRISGAPSRKVLINEVAWMGSPAQSGESSSAASNNEWIEIKNISDHSIDLFGYQLVNEDDALHATVNTHVHIPVGEFALFERTDDESVRAIAADLIYKGSLGNNGEHLQLFDATCALEDDLDASGGWPAGESVTKHTLERNADGWGTHTSATPGGSPRAENFVASAATNGTSSSSATTYTLTIQKSGEGTGMVKTADGKISCGSDCSESYAPNASITLTAVPDVGYELISWTDACSGRGACGVSMTGVKTLGAVFDRPNASPPSGGSSGGGGSPPQGGSIVLSEIFYDAEGGDAEKEFIELYNMGGGDVDLTGWSLKKGDSSLGTINTGSKKGEDRTVIHPNGYYLLGLSNYSGSPSADAVRSATLPNEAATISLFNKDKVQVDSTAYTDGAVTPGQSWTRTSWTGDEFSAATPTPQNSGQ